MITMAHHWYAIQTTAGHENKVRSLIQRKIELDSRAPEDRPIQKALVPMQEVVEIKNGKKVTVERKLYPGYVLVEMDMNQETAHTIGSIQGVIKFVGQDSRFPQPLRPDEVNRLLGVADAADELDTIVERADQALYLSKYGGRNRLTLWQASPPRAVALAG